MLGWKIDADQCDWVAVVGEADAGGCGEVRVDDVVDRPCGDVANDTGTIAKERSLIFVQKDRDVLRNGGEWLLVLQKPYLNTV